MPRNLITVVPRRFALPTQANRGARELVIRSLHDRYRPRTFDDGSIQIDFPKSVGRAAARARVVEELDRLEPRWQRLFVIYPRLGD